MKTLGKNHPADRSAVQRELRQRDFIDFAASLGRPAEMDYDPRGWLRLQAIAHGVAGHEALMAHSTWSGPTKLVHGPDGLVQQISIPLPARASCQPGALIGAVETGDLESLMRAVFRAARRMLASPAKTALRNRVQPSILRSIVCAAGHAVAADEQGGLRLTIGHGGFDGQTQIHCSGERLRLVMQLGRWTNLPAAVESAMHLLATEANARTRLVRIAWLDTGDQRRCEAQVDLTEAPWVDESHACFEPFLQRLLLAGLAGLGLAARRLGRELAILADPVNRCLAEALAESAVAAPSHEDRGH